MSSLEIRKVAAKSDLKAFIKFPWKVYAGDPNWVPPLILDMKEKLDRRKNPFFEHSEMDLFLARRGGEMTGRVAAILDRNHNSFHGEKVVFFGLYESLNDPETAGLLLDAVAAWGIERGMDTLRGPMSLSMNDECAFLLEGFDSPPVVMMPYNPSYYPDLMEKCGLAKAKDLFAYIMNRDHDVAAKIGAIVEKIRSETAFVLRKGDRAKADAEARIISGIYNAGWEKNWGFVPWTEKEMEHMVGRLKRFADMDLVIIAEHEGKPAGFALGFPNYNEVLRRLNGKLFPLGFIKFLINRKKIKGIRALVFGVLKEYRHTGLSYLLYDALEKAAQNKGYEWGEISWVLEDNEAINRFNASIGGRIYKRYRIFEKKIAG